MAVGCPDTVVEYEPAGCPARPFRSARQEVPMGVGAYLDSTCPTGSGPVVSASHAVCHVGAPG